MRSGNPHKKRSKKRRLRWKRWVIGLPMALLFPFLLLVRFSTWLYAVKQFNGWFAVLLSALTAGLFLGLVVVVVFRKFGVQPQMRMLKIPAIVVCIYCVYLLVFISTSNVKADDIQATYMHLHPVLRVALSSLVVVDRGIIVTGSERIPSDYAKMSLATRSNSDHYEQSDGYVHAVDLRTRTRSELMNRLTQLYFEWMGFSTLRHVGTADHLHVSLPL